MVPGVEGGMGFKNIGPHSRSRGGGRRRWGQPSSRADSAADPADGAGLPKLPCAGGGRG